MLKPADSEFKRHLLSAWGSIAGTIRDVRFQTHVDGISHAPLVSHATYSPWLDDLEFQAIWNVVASHSLVDVYRMYLLWTTADQVCRNPTLAGDVLEVGTWRGGSGCLIAARCALLNPQVQVFLADTFAGVAKSSTRDTLYQGGEHSDTSPVIVGDLVGRLSLTNISVLQGVFPEETGQPIADRSFRLCHIDVDTYQSGREVFEWVWPRLVAGGVVVFDDFGFWGCEGITRLVHELAPGADRLLIHNLSGQAIFVKISSERPNSPAR